MSFLNALLETGHIAGEPFGSWAAHSRTTPQLAAEGVPQRSPACVQGEPTGGQAGPASIAPASSPATAQTGKPQVVYQRSAPLSEIEPASLHEPLTTGSHPTPQVEEL